MTEDQVTGMLPVLPDAVPDRGSLDTSRPLAGDQLGFARLDAIFLPRRLLLVGGKGLRQPIRNLRALGFDGEIWVLSTTNESIEGIACFSSLDELPGAPDTAFLAIRASACVGMICALRQIGCRSVVCYAAGFAETGEEGKRLQDQLLEAAGPMPLVGPNCYGVLNLLDRVALWPDRVTKASHDRGVAIVSQSGNLALNLSMADRSVPVAYVISVGNQAMLEIADYVDWLLEGERVTAIGLYVEGLKDVLKFSRAALKALDRGVPLVILKVGASSLGASLAMSHTSSLAGRDDLYQAMFDRLGVLRVDSLSALLETLKVLSVCPMPEGRRLGALTCSGGDSALLADGAASRGLDLPPLSDEQQRSLDAWLPAFATRANPLDYNMSVWGNEAALRWVFSVMRDERFDMVVLVLDFPREVLADDMEWRCAVAALKQVFSGWNRPVALISNFVELMPADVREQLLGAGIAPLQGMNDALSALGALVRYAEKRQRVWPDSTDSLQLMPVSTFSGNKIRLINEWDAKQWLKRHGLSVPAGQLAPLSSIGLAARQVGFPVVLKAVSDQLAHKTEAGAVVLGLQDERAVETAARSMRDRLAAHGVDESFFLVEPMVQDGVAELIIGLTRDPVFGLALVVGIGGVLVNLLDDSVVILLPATEVMVRDALSALRHAGLLLGYRNRPKADLDAVVSAVMAVAAFARDNRDRLLELDVNPLIVRPEGMGAVAADALIRVTDRNLPAGHPV